MSIHERLEHIRKSEKLSRTKFGRKLGKSEDAIYNLERARASISDEFIELVCTTFNINKDWLVNGSGEMYDISPESLKLSGAFDKILDSKDLSVLVSQILTLSDEKIKVLSDLVQVLSENEKK